MNILKIALSLTVLYSNCITADQTTRDYIDATHEINTLDGQKQSNKNDHVEQLVLGSFASIVQNFFSIVQNPHDTAHVGANITQMLAGIVNVAVEVMKNLPEDCTPEERETYIKNIELTLKTNLRKFAHAKYRYLRTITQNTRA